MRVLATTAIKLQAAACAGGAVVGLRLGADGRRAHATAQAVHPEATGTSGGGDHRGDAEAGAGLAHLDYLRALQRNGREVLARTAPEKLSHCRSDEMGSLDVR